MRWLVALVIVAALGDARAEHFAVRTFTTADGLANGRVYHATRDRNGFLWFATADGVSRFDGVRFESFGVLDGLPDPGCRDIHATADGRVWVATERGLAWLDLSARGKRPHFSAIHLEGNADFIGGLFEDSQHRLWLGTEDGLWTLGRHGVPERVLLREGRQPAVYIFAEDRGTLWLGTSWGLMRRAADGRAERYPVRDDSTDDRTISLRFDLAGRLWIGGVGAGPFAIMPPPPGTALLAPGKTLTGAALSGRSPDGSIRLPKRAGDIVHYEDPDPYPSYDAVRRSIFTDAEGTVWLSGEHLVVFDGERFTLRGRAEGMPEDSVVALLADDAGNVWLGGNSGGVVRFSPHGLITYDGLGSDRIMSVVEDAAGTVYAVSAKLGHTLERFERDHFVAIQPHPPSSGDVIGAWGTGQISFFDRDDRWWEATQTGLDHYPHVADATALATTVPEHFGVADGLPGRDVFKLFQTRDGDVWIATLSAAGLGRWARATNKITTVTMPGLPVGMIAAFAQDPAGALWIGFASGELVKLDGDHARVFGEADGWTAGRIDMLLIDRRGRLWIGSDAGVGRVDDPGSAKLAVVRYRAATGLSTDQTTALAEGPDGRIYVGSIHGVDRIVPETGAIDHITNADGLPSDWISYIYRDRSDQLWFATTTRGLARFRPRIEVPPPILPAYLMSVRAGTRQLDLSAGGERAMDGLELEHDESNLDVTFTSPSYAIGVPVEFQLQLEGGDDDGWTTPRGAREVHYAHLVPGRYRLGVRAVIGGVTSPAATLELEILAPFWRRAWFLVLLAGALAAIGWRIYRWRVDHLIAVERVRSRIASDLHDDLGASLARISILSEVAARRTDGVTDLVATIGRDARDLLDSASDVVWATDPRHDDLAHVLARIRTFAGELLDGPGIAWTLTAPRDAERIALGPDQRRHLYLILKEAVANIAKHAGATRVTIAVECVGRGLVATVEDDGRGIAADAKMGHGLENMRTRAKEAGGNLVVATPPTGGTRITLALRSR